MIDLAKAQEIASDVVKQLSPYCEKIEISGSMRPAIEVVGSVRRGKPTVKDIDLVLIPRERWELDNALLRMGTYKMSGMKIARVEMESISLDIYFATPETWATLLLIRTGSAENNIRLAKLAQKKGWRLKANGDGLFNEKGQRIAGDTEESIYTALGLHYQEPWERD